MSKKRIIIILIVVFILMLIPIPVRLKDGGSIEYKALLYKYTKIHRLNEKSMTGYEDGWELSILGIRVAGSIDTNILDEHIISIKSNDKIIDANTGSFCYENAKDGFCIDKIDFQDFKYDVISSYYGNKLYIDNLDGSIKSIEVFDYSFKKFIDTTVEFTNDYIITPSISGSYIFKINAIYEGKSIDYYFMIDISKISGEDINLNLKIKENTLTNVGLTMIMENFSNRDLSYGNPYSIEKYENGYWRSALIINEFGFTLPSFGLNNGETKELSINWEHGYGKLVGKYRIVKKFDYEENDNYIFFNKYLEFEIPIKVIAGTANTIQVLKNDLQDANKFNKYLERDGKTIYIASNIKEIYYDDVKTKHVLKDYVQNTWQTIDDSIKHLINYLSLFTELNDGGTRIYKSQEYDITIVKCNTVGGNKDYYIGDYSMSFDSNSMCKG